MGRLLQWGYIMTGRASLNHVFRTVWNHALGVMVAVSEIGTVRGKTVSQQTATAPRSAAVAGFRLKTSSALVAIAWAATSSIATANPAGGVAVVGSMTTATQGNQMTVTTQNGAGTNYSAINWQSFSVPQGSSTYFQQPSSSSAVINRVVTNTPSQLFGTLGSNGRLVLVNQSGITVGAGAVVDTAGFTASALKMTDADALAARMRFGDGTTGGNVSVQGQVLARSGDVVLIGSNVDTGKDALIQAPNGSTILAAGNQVEITGRGLEGISMTLQAPENNAVNLGTLKGDAVGIFAGTLKHSGAIQATRATLEGGKVVLKAAGDAIVDGAATINATGTTGGAVDVLGQRVGLTDTASIDVSGANGGGQVRIGGDYQGKNASIPNAQFAYVGKDVSIKANATDKGNGGRLIVWADDTTRAYGSIEAKGGVNGGDGGFIETSGKKALLLDGVRVNAAASSGRAGSWLLDPADVTISSVSGDMTQTGGLFVPVNGASTVLASTLTTALQGGTDVTVTTYDTTLNPTAFAGGTAAGDITVGIGTFLSWTSTAKLTLDANNSISIGSSITATNGQLSLLASNRPSASSGTISNGGSLIKVKKLEAVANGAISLTGYNEIENLAAKSVAGAITIESAHASGLTITSVGGISGLSAAGNIDVKQYTAGGIAVNAAVKSSGYNASNAFQTQLGIASGSGSISVGADVVGQSVSLYTSGGAISQSGGSVKDNGNGTTVSSAGAISLSSSANDFSTITQSGTATSLYFADANGLTLGNLNSGGAVTAKAGGDLSFGNITASSGAVSLTAGGLITQTSETTFTASSVSLSAGTGVGTSSNVLNIYSIPSLTASTVSGGVYIQSGTAFTIQGITAGSGDIVVTNYGGITTTGLVSTGNGKVTMTANSPLTVGSGGVSASGNISLTAASTGNMTLNGPIKSSAGSVTMSATGGTLTQNGSVYGATGVSASASSMVYGSGATTTGSPVSYTSSGVTVTPPIDPIAIATTSGALVTTFEDLLTAAVQEQAVETQVAQNDEKKTDPLLDGSVGEICLR